MEYLESLQTIVKQLLATSDQIVKKSIPILRKIKDDKQSLIKTIKETHPNMSNDDILDQLHKECKKLIGDAQSIKNEHKTFIQQLFDQNLNDELFMSQVWTGDMFGSKGIDGLKLLQQDLEEQLKNINLENVLAKIK